MRIVLGPPTALHKAGRLSTLRLYSDTPYPKSHRWATAETGPGTTPFVHSPGFKQFFLLFFLCAHHQMGYLSATWLSGLQAIRLTPQNEVMFLQFFKSQFLQLCCLNALVYPKYEPWGFKLASLAALEHPGGLSRTHRSRCHWKILGNFYAAVRSTCRPHSWPVTRNLILCFSFRRMGLAGRFMVDFSLTKFKFRWYLRTNSRTFLPLQLPGKQTCGLRACSLWSLRLQRCQRLQQTQCLKREKHHDMVILARGLSVLLIHW